MGGEDTSSAFHTKYIIAFSFPLLTKHWERPTFSWVCPRGYFFFPSPHPWPNIPPVSKRRKFCLLEGEKPLGSVGHPAALLWFQGKLSSRDERDGKCLRTTCRRFNLQDKSEALLSVKGWKKKKRSGMSLVYFSGLLRIPPTGSRR